MEIMPWDVFSNTKTKFDFCFKIKEMALKLGTSFKRLFCGGGYF